MKIYNTPNQQIEEIRAISFPEIKVYTCGPTVYDYSHVGHWFNYIRMDTLIRCLKLVGFRPIWVMNITDVGHLTSDADDGVDKLEAGAKREGKTAWQIAEFYTADFLDGLKLLNITQPTYLVKATDHISEQVDLIKALAEKGYTYQISDGIYYDTTKFQGYHSLAKLDLDEQKVGARVKPNPEKKHPQDFALWKFSPTDHKRDMEWDSPWGKGFPGWHIECSAMALKYLGPTLDVHTGGIDHVPVHHTNEIAQSEAATGHKFANFWFHSNHVLVEGEKISKSIGNTIRLQEVLDKGISMPAFRLHTLESHYRSQSHFSWSALMSSAVRLKHWQAVSDLRWQIKKTADQQPDLKDTINQTISRIKQALADDLNTANALAIVDNLFTVVEARLIGRQSIDSFNDLLELINDGLGIDLKQPDISNRQKEVIVKRDQLRVRSDWTKADELRQQLTKSNIGLRDTNWGSVWFHEPPEQTSH